VLTYFAYGANIDGSRMARRVAGVKSAGVGRLDGYALEFTIRDREWGGGVANIRPVQDGHVWGVLWRGRDAAFTVLDTYQGDESAQRREQVKVEAYEGLVDAFTFRVDGIANHVKPTALYLAHLRRAMAEQGFPGEAFELLIRAERFGPTGTGPSIVS
jgi:Gamma-glutamyl cyclotransferase, AIG2-like